MPAYYNEFDPYAAQWLRNLITAGHLPAGDVDERDIRDVPASDLIRYTQGHFFAGIGGWPLALRLAGWPDDRPVWTGSAPCQPFSAAGRQLGLADERHLWPAFHHLIEECHPSVVFGEQVDAAIRHGWLDLVQADLEGIGYTFAAVDLPAACVGAPHIRQRLFWVADIDGERRGKGWARPEGVLPDADSAHGSLDNTQRQGLEGHHRDQAEVKQRQGEAGPTAEAGDAGGVADAGREGRRQVGANVRGGGEGSRAEGLGQRLMHGGSVDVGVGPSPTNGHWRDADWLLCRDGKWRPVEPGAFPLAHGVPGRVGRLRAYGNAIVPQVAAEVIKAYMA